MDCVRAQQLIRPYLEGYLSDRELEEFLDHVQGCPDCFGELEIYFSIYRTLSNVDEKGDYNYARKLRTRLQHSREYLGVRQRNRVIKVGVILVAEICIFAAFFEIFRMPGGYQDRHRTEIIQVVETEAPAGSPPGSVPEPAQETTQSDQAQSQVPETAQSDQAQGQPSETIQSDQLTVE